MRFLIAMLAVLASVRALAQSDVASPEDDFIFIMKDCKLAVVDFREKPKLKISKGDNLAVYCELTTMKNMVKCSFIEGDAILAEKQMTAVITHGNMLVADPDYSDRFFSNMTTQVFYSESTVNVKNIIYGRKLCSGNMFWANDAKQEQTQKQKQEQRRKMLDRNKT